METRPARILDFDIETRRIGFHDAGRFAPGGCEPIAVAWKWVDDGALEVRALPERWSHYQLHKLVTPLFEAMAQADIVTGHYIRKFDLPILAGVALELGIEMPAPLLTVDTKLDLQNVAGLSQSQENLGELLGLEASKFHMNDHRWREAARLTKAGMDAARERVVDDVIQHAQLYHVLTTEGRLGPPVEWKP
jgi:hypothetical protein